MVKKTPVVGADVSGFTIKSTNQNFMLKIGADLQVDNRSFSGHGSNASVDSALLRRVRPTFSVTLYTYVECFFRPDFGQGSMVIYDAYLELKYFPWANVQVGKFKLPVGLERLQSDDNTSFIERGLPTLLVPSRDMGYQIPVWKRCSNYAVGVFNGVPDNGLSATSASNHRDFVGRVFLMPFASSGEHPLSRLGFGIGASSGHVDGEALPTYRTVEQNTLMTPASGVTEAGQRTRLTPQAHYYVGSFGLLAEYGVTEEGLQKGAVRHNLGFRAWQVQASYLLTGERKGFTSPALRRVFDPRNGGWGALELATRVGNFKADTGLYGYGLMDPAKSPRAAREWVGGANWYLNRLVRVSLDFGNIKFTGGNCSSEKVLLTRFQINFI